jgi:hypothetical protein
VKVTRWAPQNQAGIIFVNIYMPAFTRGISMGDIGSVEHLFVDLESSFPGDFLFFGGDFNTDRWRFVEQSRLRQPIPPLVR